ncbi:Bet1-like protein [Camellia lanceoleosa]|uniref:Bet1-like protein n=1 Tax=Camellia lanceoleosa TaxID=1840588 RepID=A0ACC0HWR4_9ERIC|nr:Bet1-like protein [Camellia lanceoleosa]
MMSSSYRSGDFYGAASYKSRKGLSTRQVASSDEIQLQIDPMHGDLDDEITGLRKQVGQLKFVAKEMGTEAKFQNDFSMSCK